MVGKKPETAEPVAETMRLEHTTTNTLVATFTGERKVSTDDLLVFCRAAEHAGLGGSVVQFGLYWDAVQAKPAGVEHLKVESNRTLPA